MQVAYYHIEDTISPRTLIFKLFVLGIIPFALRKIFSSNYWKAKAIRNISKTLSKIYIISEGVNSAIHTIDETEINKKELEAVHNISERMLFRYRKLMATFEKVDFFEDQKIKNLCENTLNNFYSFEAQLRSRTFLNSPKINEDKNLSQFTSALSLGSLQA